MGEKTMMTGFGNRVYYENMDTLDEKAKAAIASAHGGRIDWNQVYGRYAEAAQHTAYAAANRVPLFPEPRREPLDRGLRIEQLAMALTDGTPQQNVIAMIDEDVLIRTGVDIRDKFFTHGETFGVRIPVSGYMSPEMSLFVLKLMLKGAHVVAITEHGEEPIPYGISVVAPFADQALNTLQITEGIARLAAIPDLLKSCIQSMHCKRNALCFNFDILRVFRFNPHWIRFDHEETPFSPLTTLFRSSGVCTGVAESGTGGF